MRIKLTGGDDPNNPTPLSPQQKVDWNNYVSFLEKKGYKGHKDLDRKETNLARNLFDEYLKANPTASIKYDDVKKVQTEMQALKDSAQAFSQRRNDPNAKNIMAGISTVDGWPGSKTTSFVFPEMQSNQFNNGALTSSKNLGLVGGDLKPTGVGGGLITTTGTKLPPETKLEKMGDGHWYYTNKDGDLILYQ